MHDSVLHLELVNALGSNNIDAILSSVLKITSHPTKQTPSYGSPLHLVISLCPKQTVQQILDVFCRPGSAVSNNTPSLNWINTRNIPDGQTPLHLAAKLSRHDIIDLLFQIPTIDDTIRDTHGRLAEDLVQTDRMADLFAEYKQSFVESFYQQLRVLLESKDLDSFGFHDVFARNQRTRSYLSLGWIDINAPIQKDTERALLHLVAKLDNLELVDFLLKQGADPNVKDSKGKKPVDVAKADKVKERLKHAISLAPIVSASLAKATATTEGPVSIEAPVLKGMILKWVNYTTGYKPRYFVLEGGVFSYFQDVADYPLAVRGSISTLASKTEFPDAADMARFDVVSSGNVRYSLKARSPAEAKKWVWALMESQRWMKDQQLKSSRENSQENIVEPVIQANSMAEFETEQLNEQLNQISPTVGTLPVPASTNWDMHRLLYLLQVQLQVQQQAVDTAIEMIQNQSHKNDISTIPALLSHSASLVQATATQIVQAHESREQYWMKRVKKETDARKRWEDVVQRVAGIADEEPQTKKSIKGSETDEEDVFYDPESIVAESFVESAFGFHPLDETVKSSSPQSGITFHHHKGFNSLLELPKVCLDYQFDPRLGLPLDSGEPKPSLAVWSFLKSAIGKDLSKITLPVIFNEPLSMLQRMCEDVEYIELLSLAGALGDPDDLPPPAKQAVDTLGWNLDDLVHITEEEQSLLRLMLVGAYAMSNYSSTPGRVNKPFNPILGETFELVRPDKGFRYLSEQVAHHPPISACYCESAHYKYWTEVNVQSKFWGKSLEFYPLGVCHVSLPVHPEGSEHYSWKKITTVVNNIIVGTISLDHYGDMVIKNHRTGQECVISFKKHEQGWFGSKNDLQLGDVTGVIKDKDGKTRFTLSGNWTSSLECSSVGKQSQLFAKPLKLWKRNIVPKNAADNFNLTQFAMSLNQITPELESKLPLTDCRMRPDQRAMEHGKWDQANKDKERLENLQRKNRKAIVEEYAKTGVPFGPKPSGISIGEDWWVPRWFSRELDPDTREETWRFDQSYWKHRETQDPWPDYVTDIFGIKE
ncbi:Oxysterol-binding protein-domain-containing protein [Gorgonomyces haynaldii]|nr:Oxysterol-binding protein-domain-containing protein [Gorgonomyces haynaldii]